MKALWVPSPERIANANLTRFSRWLEPRVGQSFPDYDALHAWSVEAPASFWEQWWQYANVVAHAPYTQVVDDVRKLPGARWFAGSTLNFAENLLRFAREPEFANKEALVFRGEDGRRRALSFVALEEASARFASALKAAGVQRGDCVAGYMPNAIETVVAMLGATRLGAMWSSCSPDFGVQGVLDRFGQVAPKVLISVNCYQYAGKQIPLLDRVEAVTAQLSSLKAVIIVDFVEALPSIPQGSPWLRFNDVIEGHAPYNGYEAVEFDAPLFVMFSSGTTGVPKCIVHGTGGTLLQHLKEHQLHTDIRPGDRFFYYTTCGWMMWNWLVSGLASGATLVLFDGSPTHPKADSLMDLIDEESINIFGTSAKYLSALEKSGAKPAKTHRLASVRAILSTGSPLSPESFDFVYQQMKADVCLSSISGGTDIISCFALGNPVLPVYKGELQCRGLGMAVEIYNDDGQPVLEEKGELVCTRAFPSCPIRFLNDPTGEKFHSAYFARFDNIWAHGDYGEITAHKGVIIYGRSDAVLNPGGVRIGTAEIYRQVEKVDEVLESIAIGQDWQDDVRVVLFVKLREGVTLDDDLRNKIKKAIRDNTTPRHVPAKILQVTDIPRTVSGKIVELAVRNVVHGQPVKNTEALANPAALEYFRNRNELSQP